MEEAEFGCVSRQRENKKKCRVSSDRPLASLESKCRKHVGGVYVGYTWVNASLTSHRPIHTIFEVVKEFDKKLGRNVKLNLNDLEQHPMRYLTPASTDAVDCVPTVTSVW